MPPSEPLPRLFLVVGTYDLLQGIAVRIWAPTVGWKAARNPWAPLGPAERAAVREWAAVYPYEPALTTLRLLEERDMWEARWQELARDYQAATHDYHAARRWARAWKGAAKEERAQWARQRDTAERLFANFQEAQADADALRAFAGSCVAALEEAEHRIRGGGSGAHFYADCSDEREYPDGVDDCPTCVWLRRTKPALLREWEGMNTETRRDP